MRNLILWGVLWRYSDRDSHLMWSDGLPALFRTRRKAREWIDKNYGYIAHRLDLRSPPHSWRVPKAVRVMIREVAR